MARASSSRRDEAALKREAASRHVPAVARNLSRSNVNDVSGLAVPAWALHSLTETLFAGAELSLKRS